MSVLFCTSCTNFSYKLEDCMVYVSEKSHIHSGHTKIMRPSIYLAAMQCPVEELAGWLQVAASLSLHKKKSKLLISQHCCCKHDIYIYIYITSSYNACKMLHKHIQTNVVHPQSFTRQITMQTWQSGGGCTYLALQTTKSQRKTCLHLLLLHSNDK